MAVFHFDSNGDVATTATNIQIRPTGSGSDFVSYTLPIDGKFYMQIAHSGTVNFSIVSSRDTDKVLRDFGSLSTGDEVELIPGGMLKINSSASHAVNVNSTVNGWCRYGRTKAAAAGLPFTIGEGN